MKSRKNGEISKKEGIAYAKIALHLLQALHIDITLENLETQMLLAYDLYNKDEAILEGKKII